MSFIQRLADKLILQPTTNPIDPEQRKRVEIQTPDGTVEAWTLTMPADDIDNNEHQHILLLKFPGTGGRAERSGPFPANFWHRSSNEIWTVNHRGWGGSDGPATLENFAQTCDSVWQHVTETFPQHRIVLYGNSLGCISALYLAAKYSAAGIYLRNPPPLANIVATRPRYAWPSLGLSRFVAAQVPKELDSIENASRSKCPALFVCSSEDRVVPPRFQEMIIDQYAGQKNVFTIQGADHHHAVPEHQGAAYETACQWLENRVRETSYK
jgi:pimeloyl-ACP methyl ester carboxylesterase